MFIKIEIDTREPLSQKDRDTLLALVGEDARLSGAEPAAKKAAPAKKTAKKAAAPVPTEDLTSEDSPVVAGEVVEAADEDALDAALARASDLLSSGQRDRVMDALKATGAKRVSEIPADKVGAFLKALSD